jgi:acetolactate synthase-1/2/3 large subunit
MTGKPGPVYLDMPGDILYQEVDESKIEYPAPYDHAKRPRPAPSAAEVRAIVDLMVKVEQPVLITGTGTCRRWRRPSSSSPRPSRRFTR